jgi:DNA polymerase III alpha subunit
MFYNKGSSVPFAELHCHTPFSFLDGASEAEDLVERALELGMTALAATDHQGLYGAVRFASAAREAGLHPVTGMEVELLDAAVRDPGRIVVPRRRKPPRGRLGAGAREAPGPLVFGSVPGGTGEAAAIARDGLPARPATERLRIPAHREPLREDLRGVRPAELGPHLVLLARSLEGYRSLCRLASGAHLGGTKGVPRFTHALLAKETAGLVALTGCRHGELSRRLLAGDREGALAAARRLRELYGDALHVELQHHLLPDDDWLVAELARLADELSLPTVVTNDAHYARPEDRELQDVLVCIRHGRPLEESGHLRRPNGQYHLKGAAELLALPPALPGADPLVRRAWREGIARSAEIAAACDVELEFERYRFPGFPVPAGETPFSELARLCNDGVRRRYHPLTPRVLKQLAHELEVIERTGLAEFFLICWDLMRFCKERGIPAQGRGSAGDSIVAYVLGITRVDPIRHDLLFERFINEGRTTYPDVDIDFASSRREEVIQYVYERYGAEHTGMVCNVVTYRARSAVREVGVALGFPRPLVDRVAKALETYDSVMVRRDLEAEGGFAEFFQVPGSGPEAGPGAGTSTAAGGRLADAVAATIDREVAGAPGAAAATATTREARVAEERAAAMGFVDDMGELRHGRGGRLSAVARSGEGERGIGRMSRREDVGRVEGGRREREPGDAAWGRARDPERAADAGGAATRDRVADPRGVAAGERARDPGSVADRRGAATGGRATDPERAAAMGAPAPPSRTAPLPRALAPVAELRPGPSDDKGGPGDSAASAHFLATEHERRAAIVELTRWRADHPTASDLSEGLTTAGPGRRSDADRSPHPADPTAMPSVDHPGSGHPDAVAALHAARSDLDRPGTVSPSDTLSRLLPGDDRPEPPTLPPLGKRGARLARDLATAAGSANPDPVRHEHRSATEPGSGRPGMPDDPAPDPAVVGGSGHPPAWASLPPDAGRVGNQRIDPGTGVLLPADRPRGTPSRSTPPAPAATPRDPAPEQDRRVLVSSMGGIELDPVPPRSRGSVAHLSPWDRWLELCARIDGFPRHLSIHVGGMLVTQSPLIDIAPLEHATMPGRVVVQYDKRDVETLKLIKLDLLGLRMLSSIDDALRDIAIDCAVHVDLDRLPEDIPEVFRMIQAADTVGVFQIESRAQMQTLPKSRPDTLDDLVVEVAIIRPGPIQGDAVHPYLRRRQGIEPVTYLHPSLEPALAETLGVILYQEQVMKIAIDVAGFSAADSDGFRRAMGTWRSRKEMEKLHARFVTGCMTVSGLTAEQAEELFTKVAGFASFGFNKSHAAAFARTAYESAFLKLFYPAQFTAGLINAQPMGFYPVEVLINDAKRHGIAVLPVDINRSRFRTTTEWVGHPGDLLPDGAGIDRRPEVVRSPVVVVPDQAARDRYAAPDARAWGIRLGLGLVKGIGEAEGEALDAEVERRGPFRSLADVVARTELPEVVLERLIRAGALDGLGQARRELLWQLREVASATRGRTDGRVAGSRKAAGRPLDLRLPPTPAPDLPPPSELERLGDSYAILSLDARRQVVELFRPALDRMGTLRIAELDTQRPGKVAIGGLVVTRQHPMTAKGTVFLALEDETGMANVTLWPNVWAELRGVVRRHALLYVEGTLQREARVVNLVARRILPLAEVCRDAGGPDKPDGVRHMGQAGMRRLG